MYSLQLLFRAGPATLILVLCLKLGIGESQENTPTRKVLILNFNVPFKAKANELVRVRLSLQTELKECMVVKIYIISTIRLSGHFKNKLTRCLCNDNPLEYFWKFKTIVITTIAAMVEIVPDRNICPNNLAVIPITTNRYSMFKTIFIV